MATKSKAYQAAAAKIDADKFYSPTEAVTLARETGSAKFDSTVEVALKLAVHDLLKKRPVSHVRRLATRGSRCNPWTTAAGVSLPVASYRIRTTTFLIWV